MEFKKKHSLFYQATNSFKGILMFSSSTTSQYLELILMCTWR